MIWLRSVNFIVELFSNLLWSHVSDFGGKETDRKSIAILEISSNKKCGYWERSRKLGVEGMVKTPVPLERCPLGHGSDNTGTWRKRAGKILEGYEILICRGAASITNKPASTVCTDGHCWSMNREVTQASATHFYVMSILEYSLKAQVKGTKDTLVNNLMDSGLIISISSAEAGTWEINQTDSYCLCPSTVELLYGTSVLVMPHVLWIAEDNDCF